MTIPDGDVFESSLAGCSIVEGLPDGPCLLFSEPKQLHLHEADFEELYLT